MVGTQNAAVTISKSAVKNATIGIPAAKMVMQVSEVMLV